MSAKKPRSTAQKPSPFGHPDGPSDHHDSPPDPSSDDFDLIAKDIAEASSVRVSRLLSQLEAEGLTPFEVFTTVVLAAGVVGKALEMPRADLLEGVGAAFDSIMLEDDHGIH